MLPEILPLDLRAILKIVIFQILHILLVLLFKVFLPPTSRVVVLLVLQIVLMILVLVYLLWPLLSHVVPAGIDKYPNVSAIGYINRMLMMKTQLSTLFDFILV